MVEAGLAKPAYLFLVCAALFGIVVSFYYYIGVVRAIYWSKDGAADTSPVLITGPVRVALFACIAGMLFLGIFPNSAVNGAMRAVAGLSQPVGTAVAAK